MAELNINQQIAALRKNKGITQEELAVQFGVTNQTVSKWELAACCPDIQLLPDIADYFNVSIDELFGRTVIEEHDNIKINSVPWDDDGTLRGVVYIGRKLMKKTEDLSKFEFTLDGDALNVECHCNLNCGDVAGGASAGCDINCGDVAGEATAGCDLNCGDVADSASAGSSISCGDVNGPVSAGSDVTCGDISGPVTAGGSINCGDINGPITAGGGVHCN